MPGIVVFRRRWSVGSDDLVLPGIFLFLLHAVWLVVLCVVLFGVHFDAGKLCSPTLVDHGKGYLGILLACTVAEAAMVWMSMRGSILYTEPRRFMQHIIYIRLAILVVEFVYSIVGVVWILTYYFSCDDTVARSVTAGIVTCNWFVIIGVCITLTCVFDSTGRTFVKLQARKSRQRSLTTFNLRHRMEEGLTNNWAQRLKLFMCCARTKDTQTDAYSEVAVLMAEFFRDLDIVPSDIIAGLVLMRQQQRARRNAVLDEANNDILAFLSGIPIARKTEYLDLKKSNVMSMYKDVCYYMHYALAAYGWPMYLIRKPACGLCKLMANFSCCCLGYCVRRHRFSPSLTVQDDNCCQCNVAAIRRHFLDEGLSGVEIVFASIHDAVYETPFYVAVDHDKKRVVVSVRGTLSLKDALTDLTGDAEPLPVEGHPGTWLGHKGMVFSAKYVKKKLEEEMILSQAFGRDLGRGTKHYHLVIVGHSLGAGTAAILSFMLRPQYPTLKCYAYSPPGGLLSEAAMEESKTFVTSVILGKDLVPRIGLPQLETFRRQLLDVLTRTNRPKWRIIVGGTKCLRKSELLTEAEANHMVNNKLGSFHSDMSLTPCSSIPLYPPGNIVHVVHNHPPDTCCWKQEEPTYHALWADNKSFHEVVISPAMLHEHLAHVVMDGMHKVLENYNKGKTALLGAAKIMVSPTMDLDPNACLGQNNTAERKSDLSLRSNKESELSWEYTHPAEREVGSGRAAAVDQLLRDTREQLVAELNERRAPLATVESLSDNDSIGSFDSRRSSGFRSVRSSPSLRVVMERDEPPCYYVDPVIPEENPSLSSRSEAAPHDAVSRKSPEALGGGYDDDYGGGGGEEGGGGTGAARDSSDVGDRRRPAPVNVQPPKGGVEALKGDLVSGLANENGKVNCAPCSRSSERVCAPSPDVRQFSDFIDSVFNLDNRSSSFQDTYRLAFEDSLDELKEMVKSVSEREISECGKVKTKSAGSQAASSEAITTSGISVSQSGPMSPSSEACTTSSTLLASHEQLIATKPGNCHRDSEPVDCYVSTI
ncbi:unnamed protein product [Lampetra planeri]